MTSITGKFKFIFQINSKICNQKHTLMQDNYGGIKMENKVLIRVPVEIRDNLKILSAQRKVYIYELIGGLLKEELVREKIRQGLDE